MSGFGMIVSRDLRELAGGKAFRIVTAAYGVLAVALAAGAALLVRTAAGSGAMGTGAPPAGAPPAGAPTPAAAVATMLWFAVMLPFLAILWVFTGAFLSKEKATGHLETLLATPLTAKTLWLGKTTAMALPGFIGAIASSAMIAISAAVSALIRPEAAGVPLSPALLVACWLAGPLFFWGLDAITVVLSLRTSPDAAITPSFVIGFSLMIAMPAGIGTGIVDPASWAFAGGAFGLAALAWGVVLLLARGLTKERIVLSSREG